MQIFTLCKEASHEGSIFHEGKIRISHSIQVSRYQ
uniref:Uncharacterized protein n=1 Tax=Arundo donax TaxID=35708 RepID=A0A0A8YD19_ARUDO